jgi:hypothetical protein
MISCQVRRERDVEVMLEIEGAGENAGYASSQNETWRMSACSHQEGCEETFGDGRIGKTHAGERSPLQVNNCDLHATRCASVSNFVSILLIHTPLIYKTLYSASSQVTDLGISKFLLAI